MKKLILSLVLVLGIVFFGSVTLFSNPPVNQVFANADYCNYNNSNHSWSVSNGHSGDFLYTGSCSSNKWDNPGNKTKSECQADWCANHQPTPTPTVRPTATPTPTPRPTATPTPTPTFVDCHYEKDNQCIDVSRTNCDGHIHIGNHNYNLESGKCTILIEGCMDSIANNYDSKATKEGNCNYNSKTYCVNGVNQEISDKDKAPEGIESGACPIPPEPKACTENCTPTFAGSSTEAPRCGDANTILLPTNPHVIRSGSSATVNFFITQGDKANIYWRLVGQSDWQNAVSDIKPNGDKFVSYTIHDLDPKLGYDFGIQQTIGCGGGQLVTAVIIDGPISTTFTFSYWEWSK